MASQSTAESDASGYRLTPPTGVAYERMRAVRPTYFGGPIHRRLARHAVLLGAIAFAAGQQWFAATGSVAGGPVLAVAPGLAAVAAAILIASSVLLAGSARYRRRNEPLTERAALRVLAVEDAATYLGYLTGGGTALLAVALPTLGIGPSVAGGTAFAGLLAAGAAVAAVAARTAGVWFRGRVPRAERR